jgi:hypothetical protein
MLLLIGGGKMASIRNTNNNSKPLVLNQYLGLNLAQVGDTRIYIGESGNMYNCYITKDYGIKKIMGYLQLMTQVANKRIQGMWYGKVGGTNYFLFSCNGHIYKLDNNFWLNSLGTETWSDVTTDLGTLTDAPTQFFAFNDNVYIQNGYEYKYWTGTGSIADVVGYTPKINTGCTPSTGTGTPYEEENLLNGKKYQSYNGDGTTTYQLPETNIDSVDYVYVDGVLKEVTTDYTTDLTAGTITFSVAPTTDSNNVDIYWTKGTGNREEVYKNTHNFVFNSTRVMLYGNASAKNIVLYSPLANGLPSAEYFTATNNIVVGDSNTYVTDIRPSQNMLLIYKDFETYYTYYDVTTIDGIDVVNFPIQLINNSCGNVAIGQAQILNNDIFTIDTNLRKWYPTTVENERNEKDMGKRIQKDLDEYDLSNCLTIDKQNTNEMWISNAKRVWIYRYDLQNPFTKEQGVFSRLYLEDEPTCWLLVDGNLYFGTTDGKIMKFDESYSTFNGTSYSDHWEMNMYDFGASWLTKNLIMSYLTSSPSPNGTATIQFVTDKDAFGTTETLTFNLSTLENVDFRNFTFRTNYNPQTKKIRLKAKKFTLLKVVLDDFSNVLNLTIQVEYGGKTK